MNATGRQKTVIAQLCMALKIRDPLEERQMTQEEAGRLIRELTNKLRVKRAMKGRR